GLLHCDRDASGGGYAPVASADLAAAELDGWLLGHIHAPDRFTADWPVGYLGSVTGLDPGETGLHGPWVVTVEGRRITSLEQWGMAPLHWERLAVDLTDIEEPAEAQDRLLDAVRGLDRILLDRREPPEAAGLHVICTGRTGRRREVEALLGALDGEILSTGGAIQYFVHTLQYATRPEMDLETLARQSSPPGVLARQLLLLERNPEDPERQALIEQAGGRFRQQTGQPRWKPLGEPALDDETVAERLRLAGLEVLDRMLAQKEGTS
ncbi:MAG: hypothetical protein K9L28_10645, partial [Synergistales bacterium]|nr:hypothetical protein [Synergistales bacterium]